MWKVCFRFLSRLAGYGALGAFVLGLVLYIGHLEGRPDLQSWHSVHLDAEFRADRREVETFADYAALEEELFAELRTRVVDPVAGDPQGTALRYTAGSLTDPGAYTPNWNRSFERPQTDPRAGVLLLHGLSDSPYSVRALAESLAQKGAWVLALRLPGHGTAPVGLVDATWRDFVAATELGAAHIAERLGEGVPFFIVGYSNGAALAVHYALDAAQDASLRSPDGLVLLSPAIGITRAAAFAIWQDRLGRLLGLRKLAWKSILPEYDPFKYQSFAINAGEQMHQMTELVASGLARAEGPAGVEGFPQTLAFQSLVDASVLSGAVVDRLLGRLAPEGHELVLFDVNRVAALQPFLRPGHDRLRDELLADPALPFSLTLITNESESSREVVARQKAAQSESILQHPMGLFWPEGVHSLGHVALPFPAEDPWYGFAAEGGGVQLGRLAPRGERGLLIVSPADALRLRSNPFFPYLEERVLAFFRLDREGR